MSDLRFYFDENVELAVSEQLEKAGFDVVSVRSLNTRGEKDIEHLLRATAMERVLCTYDSDFLTLASQGIEHAGIAFAQSEKTTIGDWVRELRFLHSTVTVEQARGQIFYIKTKAV